MGYVLTCRSSGQLSAAAYLGSLALAYGCAYSSAVKNSLLYFKGGCFICVLGSVSVFIFAAVNLLRTAIFSASSVGVWVMC